MIYLLTFTYLMGAFASLCHLVEVFELQTFKTSWKWVIPGLILWPFAWFVILVTAIVMAFTKDDDELYSLTDEEWFGK